ncbi:spermatogenesis-associated protein 17 isoform X1 [Entelurus aequoreus]|uniref:spermatogenesis-associated protein 17 isoform X1 n=1 Tax=Entelurus aequoreus TaxID=161455 RepID=UPI002B1DB9BC|nr:spermatogenesis-associated protein 17 isoform X1 [Entelurus aequoreus]
MAELLKIRCKIEEFRKQQFYKERLAEANKRAEFKAVLKIQSWFRGHRVRIYIRHLHEKAVIIQKIWRGFRARALFRQMVTAAYFIMKMNFYNEMAVRIQRRWRGFYVRKYIHSFYSRKSYLTRLSRKNEVIRKEMDELEELQKRERSCLKKVNEQKSKVYQAYRWHHLLSTKQCPGVFNSPFRLAPHEMESLLRQVKYQAPTRLVPRESTHLTPASLTPPTFAMTPGSPRRKSRACCSPDPVLPPITNTKQQVQIRDPGDMWEQGVCFPELSSHLQTSYGYLEDPQNEIRLHSGTLQTESMQHQLDHSNNLFSQPDNVKSFTYLSHT